MNHDYTADICGIVLYTFFLALVCARTRPFFQGPSPRSSTDNIKLSFHLSLLGSSILEIVHYGIAIAFRGSVLSGYACHLVALWLSLVAFSLVIVLWSNTLNPPRRSAGEADGPGASNGEGVCCSKTRISAAAKVVCAIDAVVAVSTVAVLWTGSVPAYSRPYLMLMVTHSVTLFLLASWLVLYGIRLQRRVMGHPRWEPLDRRQRLKILCRINGVLVVCAACFLVRVAVLSCALFARSRHRAEEMNRLLFELLARWVAGLIPGVALLHIMCKTKKPADDRPTTDRTRLTVVHEDQPLSEPLLPNRGNSNQNGGGLIGMGTNSSGGRGSSPVTLAGGGTGTHGAGAGGGSGAHDSFVYHVVRSRQERTETTI